ncbi:MAG: redoxin domain-containing protein [Myxococcales bacterium FL481]|nr:MAG: redoxin domain-containing protein [Myxococcales bacterium FL481]
MGWTWPAVSVVIENAQHPLRRLVALSRLRRLTGAAILAGLATSSGCGTSDPAPPGTSNTDASSDTDDSATGAATDTPTDTGTAAETQTGGDSSTGETPGLEDACVGIDPGRGVDAPTRELDSGGETGEETGAADPGDSETGDDPGQSDTETGEDDAGSDSGTGEEDEDETGEDTGEDTGAGTGDDTGDDTGETGTGDPEDPQADCEDEDPPAYCVGSPMPEWSLDDYQPLSCGYDENYGLADFAGHVTVFGLWQGWCGFCQAQAVGLERMRLEFRAMGIEEVQFVALNGVEGLEDKQELSRRCAFPMFQDTDDVNAWAMFDGEKDDFYVYGTDGTLAAYLPGKGGPSINLANEDGYTYVRDTILEVLGR